MASKKVDGLYKRGRYHWASRDPLTGKRNVPTKCTDLEAARLWLRHRERLAADLAPLSRSQCDSRGLRHSSEDDHTVALYGLLQWPARARLGEVAP